MARNMSNPSGSKGANMLVNFCVIYEFIYFIYFLL